MRSLYMKTQKKPTFFGAAKRPRNAHTNSEVMTMSPKELLYIEDALGHTQFLTTQCREAANTLSDPALRGEAQKLADSSRRLFDRFYSLV